MSAARPRWPGLPISAQILALLVSGLVAAQATTLILTLVLPPSPPQQHSLQDVAAALRGADVAERSARPLVRSIEAAPPSLQSPGWLVSQSATTDLARILAVPETDVRLLFYAPPPLAGAPPPRTLSSSRADAGLPPRLAMASFGLIAQAGSVAASGPVTSAGGVVLSGPPPPMAAGGLRVITPDGATPGGFMIDRRPQMSAGGPVMIGRPGEEGAGFPSARLDDKVRAAARERLRAGVLGLSPSGVTISGLSFAPGLGVTIGRHPGGVAVSRPGSVFGSEPSQVRSLPYVRVPVPRLQTRSTLEAAAFARGDEASERFDAPRYPIKLAPLPPKPAPRPVELAAPVIAAPPPPRPAEPLVTLPPPKAAPPARVAAASVPAPPADRPLPQPAARGLFGLTPAAYVEGEFVAAYRQAPGRWVTVRPQPEGFPNSWQRRVLLWFAISFALVAPLGWLFAHRLAAPLRRFASAAERLGRDPSGEVAALDGPAEVGRAARAFNLMQGRLKRYVDDRNGMIGAISHDLRTPLARMRFRLERAPPELQRAMGRDIAQMEAMISSVLTFMRDDAAGGARERVDLRSLLECVVDEAGAGGGVIDLAPGGAAEVEVDVLGVQRVFENLVDNALKYGERADVRLFLDGGEAVAEVADRGPGLPDEDLEQVFKPFYRGPAARLSSQQGIGLGLAVSRATIRAHGGDLKLARAARGLVAQVRLPLAVAA